MVLEQKRLALDEFLCRTLGDLKCYYSPPPGYEMKYPCIKYDLADPKIKYADNIPYFMKLQWVITVIDENPDSSVADLFFNMPSCTFDRKYSANDLNHFVFSLYF